MINFTPRDLINLSRAAKDLEDENGEFAVEHWENGIMEVCKVFKGTDEKGDSSWAIGGYQTSDGRTFLAVVAGKVLAQIIVHGPKKIISSN